jgi:hypothetical protein
LASALGSTGTDAGPVKCGAAICAFNEYTAYFRRQLLANAAIAASRVGS